ARERPQQLPADRAATPAAGYRRRPAEPDRDGIAVSTDQSSEATAGRPMPRRIEVPDVFPAAGDVRGKRVVLTGAGRGLGEVIAHALSRAGAKVVLVAR